MFRKPRENSSPSSDASLKPSTGRPPTPPNSTRLAPSSAMSSKKPSTKPLTPLAKSKSNASLPKSAVKKTAFSKTPGKPNSSILSFFKKVDSPLADDSIFVYQGSHADVSLRPKDVDEKPEYGMNDIYNDEEDLRFNELNASVKRRKTSNEVLPEFGGAVIPPTKANNLNGAAKLSDEKRKRGTKKPRRSGPFLSDSDSGEDESTDLSPKTTAVPKNGFRDSAGEGNASDNSSFKPKVTSEAFDENAMGKVSGRKQVDVSEAQAKWEALQPKKRASKVEKIGESSGSEYEEENKRIPKLPALKQKSVKKHLSGNEGVGRKRKMSKDSALKEANNSGESSSSESSGRRNIPPKIPSLKNEANSVDEWERFEDLEDFPDDEFAEGEEFVERKWMEEQARLERAEQELLDEPFNGFEDNAGEEGLAPACPICNATLGGISCDDASRHVNACLDGSAMPAMPTNSSPKGSKEVKRTSSNGSNQFIRKAAIARPGQANPFALGGASSSGPTTAFAQIMSGKAEDAAWASAAAAENSSRGKPAYQRTCPFYKIMPGFFICVDAFRYGAVQGCKAYFLSHFHSDHYVGLTSTWCHGPIYCSKVTANLVKQQLRVDPKWVVPLEFEVKSEVPGTQGVQITMIPANHCPGSSLFLFEKVVGTGPNPKVQRILHCGDFRACPAHISHPQLMPDIVDSITGKTKQQKIDVCYLDTTYLNPRYSFPSQEEVIKACADMCVSLKKDRADESDAWEVVKKQRAGAGMHNFVTSAIKAEDDSIAMEIGSTKPRGRLLVICGTYSIGKERICMGIARALDCKIWAPPGKMRICAALEDPELMSRMTDDPKEAQIHMQMLMEIRAETLQEYLNSYKPHFSRIVGFRPSGWNYRPPNSRFTDSPSVSTVLNSANWRSGYGMGELVPQRGSTREASCFGVPYSEHSSFRELTMFVCALRIEKVVPTVNVGSAPGRAKMKAWVDKWLAERRKTGVIRIGDGEGEVRW